jgi:hypothetical protein
MCKHRAMHLPLIPTAGTRVQICSQPAGPGMLPPTQKRIATDEVTCCSDEGLKEKIYLQIHPIARIKVWTATEPFRRKSHPA